MVNWKETVARMGINEEELTASTVHRIEKVNELCERGSGQLISRQTLANIIVDEQPDILLNFKIEG